MDERGLEVLKFYISDLHFGHKNIIGYDNRPFFTVDEMDKTLIQNWNNRVTNSDTVYILGDVSWYNRKQENEILHQLNGEKVLILGNHDTPPRNDSEINSWRDYLTVIDRGESVVLSHYPIASFNGMFKGWIHLYGHVHNSAQANIVEHLYKETEELFATKIKAANVGCMMPYMDYTPRTLEEIKKAKGWV